VSAGYKSRVSFESENKFINYCTAFDHNGSADSIPKPKNRKIPSNPFRVLEAPGLCDDFYLNLVDWSPKNVLAVALEHLVFIWNARTSQVKELCNVGLHNQVTSLGWSKDGDFLTVGTRGGEIWVMDAAAGKRVRTLYGHDARVSSLAWNNSMPSVMASGSKDKTILVRDVRESQSSYMRLVDHRQEVCGLRWSLHDENQLASGGNDNKMFIWSPTSTTPLQQFSEHQAAVKAINWSPLHRGLLATGGGTADQCIRFWDTVNLRMLNCINTGSQVCNLVFSKTSDELVSTHGYSLNQVIVWKYPTMEKLAALSGHTFRVLYLAMSPDGSSVVTGAGDETLRFWNLFPKAATSKWAAGSTGPAGGSRFSCPSSDMR
jgi:cell division cycle 20-like protein 1 (cofactor of APC complex)